MKNIIFAMAVFSLISSMTRHAWASARCPGARYDVGQVSLNSRGIVTRIHHYPGSPAPEITAQVRLGRLDEITLDAAPGRVDATLQVRAKLTGYNPDDAQGNHSTLYDIRVFSSSHWGGGKIVEKAWSVKVSGNDLSNSPSCGTVEAIELKLPAPPTSARQ